MSLKPNPFFRKAIVPWYESKKVCWSLIVFMILVILFAFAGLSVALSDPLFQSCLWVPVLLLILALIIMFSSIRQLMRFYTD